MNPKHRKSRKRRNVARHRAPTHKAQYRRAGKAPARRRKSNPGVRRIRRPTHSAQYRRRNRHYRHNPAWLGGDLGGLAIDSLFAIGGGIGTRSLPQLIATSYNTGVIGYLMNLMSAFGMSFVAGKFAPARARATLLGGIVYTSSRIVDDFLHVQLATFAQFNPTATPMLSGDVGYGVGLAGAFRHLEFAVPSISMVQPNAPAALPAAGGSSAAAAAAAPIVAAAKAKMQGAFGRSF